jgi:hypothetical protein
MQFDSQGELLDFIYDDPIDLVTGTVHKECAELDPGGVAIAFDIAACDVASNRLRFWPEDRTRAFGLNDCFSVPGQYWLDIKVSAEHAPTEPLRLGIKWGGKFSELQVVSGEVQDESGAEGVRPHVT